MTRVFLTDAKTGMLHKTFSIDIVNIFVYTIPVAVSALRR